MVQDYAAFLYTIPWYKFPFDDKLDGLMAISAPTPSPIRSWERDFALGAEYFVKIGYAWLIQKALDASSDDEPRDIMLVVATLPPEALAKEPRIKPIRALTPEWQLVQTPRYKDFTEIIQGLLDQGIPHRRDRRQSRNPHHRDRAESRGAGREGHRGAVFARPRRQARLPQGRS